MKLTKYEYNHKDCDKTGRSYYANPVERLAFIILINLAILSLPFGLIFIDIPYNITYAIIVLIGILVFSTILEYNPVMIINYIDYIHLQKMKSFRLIYFLKTMHIKFSLKN